MLKKLSILLLIASRLAYSASEGQTPKKQAGLKAACLNVVTTAKPLQDIILSYLNQWRHKVVNVRNVRPFAWSHDGAYLAAGLGYKIYTENTENKQNKSRFMKIFKYHEYPKHQIPQGSTLDEIINSDTHNRPKQLTEGFDPNPINMGRCDNYIIFDAKTDTSMPAFSYRDYFEPAKSIRDEYIQTMSSDTVEIIDLQTRAVRVLPNASNATAHTITIWNTRTRQPIKLLAGNQNSPTCTVAWSSNGKFLASGSWDGTIKIWDVSTGACVKNMIGHKKVVTSLAWRSDDLYLASGSDDYTTKLWDVTTGECLNTFAENVHTTNGFWSPDRVFSVAWSTNRQYVLVVSEKSVRSWAIREQANRASVNEMSFREILQILNKKDWRAWARGFCEEDVRRILNITRTNNPIPDKISERNRPAYKTNEFDDSVQRSPDGLYLASCLWNSTLRVWENEADKLSSIQENAEGAQPANPTSVCRGAGTCTIM